MTCDSAMMKRLLVHVILSL